MVRSFCPRVRIVALRVVAVTLGICLLPAGASARFARETVAVEVAVSGFIAASKDGNLHVVWESGGAESLVRYASNPGGTWSGETVAIATAGRQVGVSVDSFGAPQIVFARDGLSSIHHATGGGGLWIAPVIDAGEFTGNQRIALDGVGVPHVAYSTTSDARYATLSAGNWLIDTLSSESGDVGWIAVAVEMDGTPHVAFGTDMLRYGKKTNGTWDFETVDSSLVQGGGPSLALSADGAAHISYWRNSSEDPEIRILKYADNSTGAWDLETVLESSALVMPSSGSPGFDLDTFGDPQIAFVDSLNGRILYAGRIAGEWRCETAIDLEGQQSVLFGLAVGTDSRPHIVFFDTSLGEIVHAFGDEIGAPKTFSLSGSIPDRRYFMLSLPVAFPDRTRLSSALASLGPYGLQTWRGFGFSADTLTEDPFVEVGRGYLVASATTQSAVDLTGLPLPKTARVDLAVGWNMVGVPSHTIEFDWADVLVQSDTGMVPIADSASTSEILDRSIWWYQDDTNDWQNDDAYEVRSLATATSLENRWGGYYLFAKKATSIEFPAGSTISGKRSLAPALSSSMTGDWQFHISARGDGVRSGDVILGVQSGSSHGADPGDVMKPPSVAASLSLSIRQEEAHWPDYMHAFAPPDASEYRWRLRLTGIAGTARIVWTDVQSIPLDYNVYLVDSDRAVAIDLRLSESHSMVLSNSERHFEVQVSRRKFEGTIITAPAAWLELDGAHPVRESFGLRFETPVAGLVEVILYNIVGREISTLYRDRLDRGIHGPIQAPNKGDLASGIYFVQLRYPGGSVSKKAVIMP